VGLNLDGRTALVTGGSRGIGRGISLELARRGANVVIDFHQNRVAADAVVTLVRAMGRSCEAVQADVGDSREADDLVARSTQITGSLDIVVSNAGVTRDALLARMTDEKWNEVLRINLTGAFNVVRAASRQMIRQKSGRIVLISSVVGLSGNAGRLIMRPVRLGLSHWRRRRQRNWDLGESPLMWLLLDLWRRT